MIKIEIILLRKPNIISFLFQGGEEVFLSFILIRNNENRNDEVIINSFLYFYFRFFFQLYFLLIVSLPLHTKGRFIVDEEGNRIKLACVNWYGAEEMDFVVAGLEKVIVTIFYYKKNSFLLRCQFIMLLR